MNEVIENQIKEMGNLADTLIAASGASKRAIADEVGVSVNTINNFISGKNVNLNTALSLFAIFGLNIKDLAEQLEAHFGLPELNRSDIFVEPEMDIEAVKEGAENTSVGQTAWRMGQQVEDLTEVLEPVAGDNTPD
jgi:plasmid maintenance system antidote protein VapI